MNHPNVEFVGGGSMSHETQAARRSLAGAMKTADTGATGRGRASDLSRKATITPLTFSSVGSPASMRGGRNRRGQESESAPVIDKLAGVPDDYAPGHMEMAASGIEASQLSAPAPRRDLAGEAEKEAQRLLGPNAKGPHKRTPPKTMGPGENPAPEPPEPGEPREPQTLIKGGQSQWAEPLESADPIVLSLMLIKNFQNKWTEWEPETLWSEMVSRMGFIPSEDLRGRIMAIRLLIGTDRFHTDFQVFEKVVLTLNGRKPVFNTMQAVSPEEIARALTWATKLQERDFDEKVLAYIAAVCFDEGLYYLPDPLHIAQKQLDRLLKNDGLRDSVMKRWEAVKHTDLEQLQLQEETPVDIIIARMASVAHAAKTGLSPAIAAAL